MVEMVIDLESEAKEVELQMKKETQKKAFDIFRSALLAFVVPLSIIAQLDGYRQFVLGASLTTLN